MTSGRDFQLATAGMDPRATGVGDTTPIQLGISLSLSPALLGRLAEESERQACRIDDIILAALAEKYG